MNLIDSASTRSFSKTSDFPRTDIVVMCVFYKRFVTTTLGYVRRWRRRVMDRCEPQRRNRHGQRWIRWQSAFSAFYFENIHALLFHALSAFSTEKEEKKKKSAKSLAGHENSRDVSFFSKGLGRVRLGCLMLGNPFGRKWKRSSRRFLSRIYEEKKIGPVII